MVYRRIMIVETMTILLLLSTSRPRAFSLLSRSHSGRAFVASASLFSDSRRTSHSRSSPFQRSPLENSCSSSSSSTTQRTMATSSTTTPAVMSPPVAQREEDRVVYAGVAPKGWDVKLPRQSATSDEALLDPPVAIPDPYGWMRDESRKEQAVLDHLNAENDYTTSLTQHLESLRGTLYEEMVASIQETDYQTPRPQGNYYYYTRTVKGESYTIYCRAPKTDDISFPVQTWDGTQESPILPGEQVILNVNELAQGQKYCSMGSVKRSPSQKLLAYSADYTGGETCLFYVKDLDTNKVLHHDPKLEISGSLAWGADDSTLFYLKLDAAHRPYQVYKRNLATSTAENGADDQLLLEELDDLYWMGIYKSLDGRYLFVEASSKETSEIHFLDLHDPNATLQCIAPRRPKVLYEVSHREGQWWISSNVGNLPNMALFVTPAVADSASQWTLVQQGDTPLFPGSYQRSLDHVTCFAKHVVASGREGGIPRVWVLSMGDDTAATSVQDFQRLTFAEDAYDVGLGGHYEYETTQLVVGYDSMVTPQQSIEIDMTDLTQRVVLKEKAVPGYDSSLYATERTTVTARDGTTEIPVTLVYRKDVMEQHVASGEPVPTHLYGAYVWDDLPNEPRKRHFALETHILDHMASTIMFPGYGSYGACMEADFRATRLALLNRGIVYVIAHIRGGGEMGRQWYEEPNGAKYLCKKNTFNDFVDVARWLVDDRKLTAPEVFSCEGRSAGGLLIGGTLCGVEPDCR